MSLLVWLPMTKDLSDQGLGGCTITNDGATLDNNGKLGKCYNFDGTNDRILVSGLNKPKDISIAFWLKRNATTNTRQFLFTAWSGVSIELTTTNTILGKVSFSSGEGGSASGGTITADTGWVHVCYTFEDGVGGKMYINGELKASGDTTNSINWSSTTTGYIGNYSNVYLNAKMNDFRIYDSCLSPKEIEILSRGLVAHYPLSNNGGGQPNLYDFESVANKWAVEGLTLANATDEVYGNVLKITSPSSVSSKRIYRTVSNVWKADTKFTVSFLAKASKTAVVKMSRSLANYAPDVTVGTTWKRYSTVITCSTTTEGGTLSIQTSTASADIYITQIKLELGDKATTYCPGVGDSHYIPLGYNSTTEYDVSGYGNNMTKTGTITYTSDSARYSVASHFINGSYIMANQNCGEYLPKDSLTVNLWVKPTTWGTPISCTEGGGWNIELSTNGLQFQCYISSVGYKGATSTVKASDLIDGKWHMLTGVFDRIAQQTKFYIDGELKGTNATGSTNGVGYASNRLIISGEAQSTTPATSTFVGEESDVRIYATALSATQVAELYNTAVSVANNGTLMGYELVEG